MNLTPLFGTFSFNSQGHWAFGPAQQGNGRSCEAMDPGNYTPPKCRICFQVATEIPGMLVYKQHNFCLANFPPHMFLHLELIEQQVRMSYINIDTRGFALELKETHIVYAASCQVDLISLAALPKPDVRTLRCLIEGAGKAFSFFSAQHGSECVWGEDAFSILDVPRFDSNHFSPAID